MALDVWVIDFKVIFRKASLLFPFAAVWVFHIIFFAIVFVSPATIWPWRVYMYLWVVFFLVILMTVHLSVWNSSQSASYHSKALRSSWGCSQFLQRGWRIWSCYQKLRLRSDWCIVPCYLYRSWRRHALGLSPVVLQRWFPPPQMHLCLLPPTGFLPQRKYPDNPHVSGPMPHTCSLWSSLVCKTSKALVKSITTASHCFPSFIPVSMSTLNSIMWVSVESLDLNLIFVWGIGWSFTYVFLCWGGQPLALKQVSI